MIFSVIIPTFNRAEILEQTIKTVLGQNFEDFEVIVVDDGSTDDTSTRVKTISDHRVQYFYKKNEERSIARNFGAARSRGRYLIFLDSDDRMCEDHLSGINKYLIAQSFKPRFLFTGFEIRDASGTLTHSEIRTGFFPARELLFGNYLGCSAVVVERELFIQHQFNTDPALIVIEDWELWLRILAVEPLHCIPAGSIIMLEHKGRSVLKLSTAELQEKVRCFTDLARSNPLVNSSSHNRRKLRMGLNSFAALHAALSGDKRRHTLKFLVRALLSDPALLGKRRFFAIIKHLF